MFSASCRSVFRTFAIVTLVSAAGCGSETGPEVPQLVNGSMSAKLDGGSWAASVAIAATYSGNVMAIAGTDSQQRTLGFGAVVSGPGTFQVGVISPANGSLFEAGKSWQAAITLGSGSITVTSISAAGAKGTFQFTLGPLQGTGAAGNRVVTEGVFDVKF